jgi:hypothetical protein
MSMYTTGIYCLLGKNVLKSWPDILSGLQFQPAAVMSVYWR